MNVNESHFPASEFQTSIRDFISVYTTSMNPVDIQMLDKVPENISDGVDGMFVFYGLGGILISFVIYMLCYSYFIHCKEVAQRQEIELRELNERVSRNTYRPPRNEGRIFVEDFIETGCTSLTLPNMAEGSFSEKEPGYLNEAMEGKQDKIRIIDMPQVHYRSPQEILERKFFPEDFQDLLSPDTTRTQVATTSGDVSEKAENPNAVGRVSSWMVEAPLCFSTPHDSNEKISSPEHLKDILCPANTTQMQNSESSEKLKSDESTLEGKDEQLSPSTSEGKSPSSPTTPDIVRRRLLKTEGTPRRPSSWQ